MSKKVEFLRNNLNKWEEYLTQNKLTNIEIKSLRSFLEQKPEKIKKKLFRHLSLSSKKHQKMKHKTNLCDLTMKSQPFIGTGHFLRKIRQQIENYMENRGFINESHIAPLVDNTYYNFTVLNIHENHPARDEQQTFFTTTGKLLRTQTSNSQGRIFKKYHDRNIKVFSIGKVFRNDSDKTHTPTFHQMEILISNCSLVKLIHEIKQFLYDFFGRERKIRLRPSYFPFTEPSYEVDIWMNNQWLEVLGCGITSQAVFKELNLPFRYVAALGCGIERLAMLKYNLKDIRNLYSTSAQKSLQLGENL